MEQPVELGRSSGLAEEPISACIEIDIGLPDAHILSDVGSHSLLFRKTWKYQHCCRGRARHRTFIFAWICTVKLNWPYTILLIIIIITYYSTFTVFYLKHVAGEQVYAFYTIYNKPWILGIACKYYNFICTTHVCRLDTVNSKMWHYLQYCIQEF